MNPNPTTTTGYYDGPEVADEIFGALEAAGLDVTDLDIDDLSELDEFHARGRAATMALAALADVRAGERVLDAGAGIGGPSRVLASHFGARVTSLDMTERFCRANERLVTATGLADRVSVVVGDALAPPLQPGSFDVVWMQAVAQNIVDKAALFASFRTMLTPGGRLAFLELVSGPGGPLLFPVPWADGPEGSHLVTAEQLHDAATGAGFELLEWHEGPDALMDIGEAGRDLAPPPAHGVGLDLLMPDYETRMTSVLTNVVEGRMTIVEAVFRAV